MDISRRLGTLVVCAVPAIIGGGIIYGIFGDYVPVFIYENSSYIGGRRISQQIKRRSCHAVLYNTYLDVSLVA